jgi:hypothetical protein
MNNTKLKLKLIIEIYRSYEGTNRFNLPSSTSIIKVDVLPLISHLGISLQNLPISAYVFLSSLSRQSYLLSFTLCRLIEMIIIE